ncbi:hypothetical protein F2P81_022444 [Scophthalmus maximus]|uniref:Uncharacterized protein n=1 Tax=Scophthalmus maximus TaxID=52904 RepID=A0A6A4RUA1_SCOMX|nr:hypothetical protein F2P81_022444 [Scophthalmus maximus]
MRMTTESPPQFVDNVTKRVTFLIRPWLVLKKTLCSALILTSQATILLMPHKQTSCALTFEILCAVNSLIGTELMQRLTFLISPEEKRRGYMQREANGTIHIQNCDDTDMTLPNGSAFIFWSNTGMCVTKRAIECHSQAVELPVVLVQMSGESDMQPRSYYAECIPCPYRSLHIVTPMHREDGKMDCEVGEGVAVLSD